LLRGDSETRYVSSPERARGVGEGAMTEERRPEAMEVRWLSHNGEQHWWVRFLHALKGLRKREGLGGRRLHDGLLLEQELRALLAHRAHLDAYLIGSGNPHDDDGSWVTFLCTLLAMAYPLR
jgi:hypothetical protein